MKIKSKQDKKVNIEFLQKRLKTDANPFLTESLVSERIEISKKTLKDFVKEHFGNDSDLISLVDKIVAEGGDSMKALVNADENYLNKNKSKLGTLEIIVQTDGSRPSFLIINNTTDTSTSPITDWGDMFVARKEHIDYAIKCVGRIDAYGGAKIGTGFLISENLILTNRHVLEAIASKEGRKWKISDGAYIDFGFEYRGLNSINRSKLKKVTFCGDKPINGKLNHQNIDIALIEIEPLYGNSITNFLPLNLSNNWALDEQNIFTIGYPTNSTGYTYSLLDMLFRSQFGFKRISPGRISSLADNTYPSWTFSHDATTLGGNSGSVVILLNEEKVSAGIHYGGTKNPLMNWGHIIAATLETKFQGESFRDILAQNNVQTVNS